MQGWPTLAGFMDFITNVMKIDPLVLPTNDPVIPVAFNVAMSIVNRALACVPAGAVNAPTPYAMAVYNLAASNLINFADDQPGRTYFADLREKLAINSFQPGMVASSGDSGASSSLLNPAFMRDLTLANLQQLKDSYGRRYLALAQSYGPTIWGLS